MKKTTSEIANCVLAKVAAEEERPPVPGRHLGFAGGLSMASPLLGGAVAGSLAPKGSGARQFWGTLGGGVAGALPGAILSAKHRNLGRALMIGGGGAGGALGSYLAGFNPEEG